MEKNTKTWKKWTEEESEKLKYHWKHSTMDVLMKEFEGRTYQSLMKQAALLGVKSEINRKRIGSLRFLDELNPKSCYWWGFIMADGHISHKGELTITLSNVDKNHLLKLNSYLKGNVRERGNFVHLNIGDKTFGDKWLSILSINAPKTYFPPDLSVFYNRKNLIPFIIGMIDGDGCIWNTKSWDDKPWSNLRIELHGNWLNTLTTISEKLKEFYGIESKISTSKRGYSRLSITTKKDLRILKDYIHNVDFLNRKWEKLNQL